MRPEIKSNKVLVVEDELDMRIFVSRLLENGGFAPILAESSDEGLKKAAEEGPVLIILDLMMSGQRGVDLFRHLKSDEKLKNIPIITLSTIDETTFYHFQKARESRFGQSLFKPEVYMKKPPEADELLTALRKLTGVICINNDEI